MGAVAGFLATGELPPPRVMCRFSGRFPARSIPIEVSCISRVAVIAATTAGAGARSFMPRLVYVDHAFARPGAGCTTRAMSSAEMVSVLQSAYLDHRMCKKKEKIPQKQRTKKKKIEKEQKEDKEKEK